MLAELSAPERRKTVDAPRRSRADEPTIEWNACPRVAWDRLIAMAGRSSLEQSWSFGEAAAAYYKQDVDRAVIRCDGEPIALVQLFRRRLLGIATVARILRGPLWLTDNLDERTRRSVVSSVRATFSRRRREALFWMPELLDAPASHVLMRAAGMRRVVTGYHSAWLALAPDQETLRSRLAGKWRNALTDAENKNTAVKVWNGRRGLDDLMAAYNAFRRRKRFIGPPGALVSAIAAASGDAKEVIVLSARSQGEVIAGVVLIRHGASATYYVSWTSPEGRRRRCHNLLLWRGITMLMNQGVAWLDLGGIDTVSAPGVARFKLGLKPEVFTLAGTYF